MINIVAAKFNRIIQKQAPQHNLPKIKIDFHLAGENLPRIFDLGTKSDNILRMNHFAKEYNPNALKIIKDNGYEIYITDDFDKVIQQRRMNPSLFDVNDMASDGICHNSMGQRFIAVKEMNDIMLPKTINHELSHALDDVMMFRNEPETITAFLHDINNLRNSTVWQSFERNEKNMLQKYFLTQSREIGMKEAVADLIAVKFKEGGVYCTKEGGGRENVMQLAFPKLNAALDKFVMPVIS